MVLVPLGTGADPAFLTVLAAGIIWVAALLASLLGLDGLFRSDFEDGTLEQMLISSCPLMVLVLAKVTAHWLITGLPLTVFAPLLGTLFALPMGAMPTLVLTLLLGTPVLSLIGAIGVALTVGLGRGNGLLPLLILPLYIPVLIFGAGAVNAAASAQPVAAPLYMLGAFLILALTLAPAAAGAALRISLN